MKQTFQNGELESKNLLDEFSTPEPDLDEYRKSYRTYKELSIILTLITILCFIYSGSKEGMLNNQLGIYIICSIFIVVLIVFPAFLIASIWVYFVKGIFTYKDRVKRVFWFVYLFCAFLMLIVSILAILGMNP